MARITVDRDPSYAPCGFLVCLVDDQGNWDTRNEDRTILVQSDRGFPGLARDFGWEPSEVVGDTEESWECFHPDTDGTTDCRYCGLTATEFIGSAADYLHSVRGEVIEDPGYFD